MIKDFFITDAFSGNRLVNQYVLFKNLINEYFIIYIDNKNDISLICYKISTQQKLYVIKNICNHKIKCIRHYLLYKNNVVLISSYDNSIKIYNALLGTLIYNFPNVSTKKYYKEYWINSAIIYKKIKQYFLIYSNYYEKSIYYTNLEKYEKKILIDNVDSLFFLEVYSLVNGNEKKDILITCGYKRNTKFFDLEDKMLFKTYNTKQYDCRSIQIFDLNNQKYVIIFGLKSLIIFDFFNEKNLYTINETECIGGCLYNNRYVIYYNKNYIYGLNLETFKINKNNNCKMLNFCDIKIFKHLNEEKLIINDYGRIFTMKINL